jgi:ribosomal-protein-alanine N-acetyltransferase
MISLINVRSDNIAHYLKDIVEIENNSFISPWNPNAFLEEVHNPVSQLWLVEEDRMVAGYVCFWVFCQEIQLLDIAVHPLKRHTGLGRLLMRKIFELGAAAKVKAVWLEVRPSNEMAGRLYESLGFKEVGRRPGYYRDTNEEAIVMRLNLTEEEKQRAESNEQQSADTGWFRQSK